MNVFSFHAELQNTDFNDLKVGDRVRYKLGQNAKGNCAVNIEVVSQSGHVSRLLARPSSARASLPPVES